MGQYLALNIIRKYYPSGWHGGSPAKVTTYPMVKFGGKLGKASFGASVLLSVDDGVQSYQKDGKTIGVHTQRSVGRTVGSMSGGLAGAEWGGVVCAPGGPVAIGCAIVGSIAGSIYGSEVVEGAVKSVQNGKFKNASEASAWFIKSGHLK